MQLGGQRRSLTVTAAAFYGLTWVNWGWRASLARVYVKSGNRGAAEMLLQQWKGVSSREIGYAEAMVMIYSGLGNKDEAFRRLQTAYQEHSNRLPWIKVEPEYDDLRSDRRFHALVGKMGLE